MLNLGNTHTARLWAVRSAICFPSCGNAVLAIANFKNNIKNGVYFSLKPITWRCSYGRTLAPIFYFPKASFPLFGPAWPTHVINANSFVFLKFKTSFRDVGRTSVSCRSNYMRRI
jgi:hypothetical protein